MQTNSSSVLTLSPVVAAHNLIQAQVEVQLYHLEASYLTETTTNSGGNIITGFEGYLKNQGIGRRKFEVTDSDRMFSASSTTYQRVRVVTCGVFCVLNFDPIDFSLSNSWGRARNPLQHKMTTNPPPC